MASKLVWGLPGVYLVVCAYLIGTQGLFGESFITLILGMPWTLVFAAFEYFNADGIFLYILALAPLALNTYLLYRIGSWIGNK